MVPWGTEDACAQLWKQKPKFSGWLQGPLWLGAYLLLFMPSHTSHLSFYCSHRALASVPWTLMPWGLCTLCPFCPQCSSLGYLTAHSLTFFRAFIFFFLISIFTLFYFTILYWFCHTLTWIHHGCTCVPKHEPPSLSNATFLMRSSWSFYLKFLP